MIDFSEQVLNEVFEIELEEGTLIQGDRLPDYEGEYDITPETTQQVLKTKEKSMKRDIVVHEIPYTEFSNVYGTTVTIAR